MGGYYPFTWISDYNKALQLIKVFTYISRNTLPAYIDGYFRIKNTPFVKGDKICVTLFNPSPDTLFEIPVNILTVKNCAVSYNGNNKEILTASGNYENYRRFTVPSISPYKIVLIEL